ncbi:MAG: 50S ribosomal protein L28 [Candidatus Caldatribacteriaceae bacterium]
MAKCEICGKRSVVGHRISHSHRVSRRLWHPNVQRVRVLQEGKVTRLYVCTSCLKAGKVQKA